MFIDVTSHLLGPPTRPAAFWRAYQFAKLIYYTYK